MAEEPETDTNPAGNGKPADQEDGSASAARPQLRTLAQYIRDLSFEIPDAPEVLRQAPEGAQLQVNVNVEASAKADELYEVALHFDARAGSEEQVIYNLELVYGGLFALKDVPQQMIQPALYIDCAALLFPFIRRLVADLTRESGFPPLLLDPIDFANLLRQKTAEARAQTEQAAQS